MVDAEQRQRHDEWAARLQSDRVTALAAWQAALERNNCKVDPEGGEAAFEEFRQKVCLKDDNWTLFDAWRAALAHAEVAGR